MSDSVLELLKSYLANRQMCVTVGTNTPSLSTLMFGIPQGSVLGPVLFLLNSNGLLLYVKALCELLTDETSLHNHHSNVKTLSILLQNCIDDSIHWTDLNHIALHPDETNFVHIPDKNTKFNFQSPPLLP